MEKHQGGLYNTNNASLISKYRTNTPEKESIPLPQGLLFSMLMPNR